VQKVDSRKKTQGQPGMLGGYVMSSV